MMRLPGSMPAAMPYKPNYPRLGGMGKAPIAAPAPSPAVGSAPAAGGIGAMLKNGPLNGGSLFPAAGVQLGGSGGPPAGPPLIPPAQSMAPPAQPMLPPQAAPRAQMMARALRGAQGMMR